MQLSDDAKYRLLAWTIVFIAAGLIGFTLAAFATGEWRYFAGTLVCLFLLRPLFTK